jgi:hypothetical protein
MNYTNNIIIFITLFIIFFIINSILKKKYINENFLNNIDSESSDTIPKIIIQTWKTSLIPKKYIEDIKSLKRYNNDYKFMFFTDDDIDIFLKTNYPEYYVSYNKLPIKIQKIDYFRYIAIYHYGGFYFDLDIKCLYPLDELIHYDCVFPVDQNIIVQKCKRPRFKKYCDIGMKILLGQYAFGAKKHNEFIKLLIDTIHNNVDKYVKEHKKNDADLKRCPADICQRFIPKIF